MATSKPTVFAKKIITHFDIAPFFHVIEGSELDGARGQKAEVIEHLLRTYSIDKYSTVMVGDRAHDVEGAKQNGVPCIGVLWGYGSEEELKAAGALAIAHTVEELGDWLLR